MMSHFLGHPLRFAISTLKATCITHLTFTHLLQVSPAQGPSMLPTFSVDGDWIVADMTSRRGRGVSVGDLVLYKIPIFAAQHGVKRVVAMPGDYVSLGTPGERGEEQMIQVRPIPSPCLLPSRESRQSDGRNGQVPEGHCWIVGDNLPASRDSRQFGPLPLALVQGKIIAKILPWKEKSWMSNNVGLVQES
ncbi:Mitochondrial inner membrane protease subunit 1 [Drechmeria coniospora]|uniref:Mitochondrial inner membrane protease subunit n=1 Tax=Drechmeria coniospora TaxID=98403 RepID=A0A151GUW1_DRECN|nr:Mitochondrial inner membrane protease subunit 1 [Drechmeria coniospora]KYK60861.1 Mitochondrial inner membrane protease subunit 1 [Drechmeria coniospora]